MILSKSTLNVRNEKIKYLARLNKYIRLRAGEMAQWAKHFISQQEKLLQFPKSPKASAKKNPTKSQLFYRQSGRQASRTVPSLGKQQKGLHLKQGRRQRLMLEAVL